MDHLDYKPTVLIVTEDNQLLSSLLQSNSTEYQFIGRESMQAVLSDPELLNHNHIVILDVDSILSGTGAVVEQSINLKKVDPTQILILIGNSELLQNILSSNIQPLIFRAFNQPINPKQLFLSFDGATRLHEDLLQRQELGEDILAIGPLENRVTVETIAEQKSNKPLIFSTLGAITLAIIGFLVLSNTGTETEISQQQIATPLVSKSVNETNIVTADDSVIRINELNDLAARAYSEGRLVSPANDNALYFYDQVLAIDPYDLNAFEGKRSLSTQLKEVYTTQVGAADFDKALETVNALQIIEPLDTENHELRENLEAEINTYLNQLKRTGTTAEIERMTVMMTEISPQLQSSKSAAGALQREASLLESIDNALTQNNLIPPKSGNAYALVSEALQKNLISNANFTPRLSALNDKLVDAANITLSEYDNVEETEKLLAFIKQLDVDPQSIALLNASISEQKALIEAQSTKAQAPETQQEAVSERVAADQIAIVSEEIPEIIAEPEPAKIIPAEIISRSAPRYPNRAAERNIEGWVSVSFIIDIEGIPQDIVIVESEPVGTFDNSAITAVKSWRFSPAINEQTNLPVESKIDSSKLQFKLTD